MPPNEQRAKSHGQRATYSTKIAIFRITLSGLVLEVGLTRIYSASIWSHFAFVAISVALLLRALGGEGALLAAAIAPGSAVVLLTGIRGKGVGDSSEGQRAKGEGRGEASLSPASRAEGNKNEPDRLSVAKPSPLTLSQ